MLSEHTHWRIVHSIPTSQVPIIIIVIKNIPTNKGSFSCRHKIYLLAYTLCWLEIIKIHLQSAGQDLRFKTLSKSMLSSKKSILPPKNLCSFLARKPTKIEHFPDMPKQIYLKLKCTGYIIKIHAFIKKNMFFRPKVCAPFWLGKPAKIKPCIVCSL